MKQDDLFIQIDMCFKLPKDFKGDLNDALEEILKYRRSIKNHEKEYKYDQEKDLYSNWWEQVNTTDRPFIAQIKHGKYNEESNTFDDLKIS